jgi:uncharacterized membrane protein
VTSRDIVIKLPFGYNVIVGKNNTFQEEVFVMKTNKLIKAILLSISSLIIGFIAMALPFHIFDTLSSSAMEILFITELIIYLAIGLTFLAIKDIKAQKRAKEKARHTKREREIEQVIDEWINIAA